VQTTTRLAEIYMLVWVAVLFAIWAINPLDKPARYVVAGPATYRWLEVFTTGLGLVLGKPSFRPPRTLLASGIYALQITLVFAILDHSFAASGFAGVHPTRALDYLYVSWTDMTTLGTVTSNSDAAHALTMATVTSGILLLAIMVSLAVNDVASAAHSVSHDAIDKRLGEIEARKGGGPPHGAPK
jgi:hypothetical protein